MRRNRFLNQENFKDYLYDLKELIHEFKGGNPQDIKGASSFRVTRQEDSVLEFLPIEVWETKERYYIQTYLAAIKELSNVQISIRDSHTLLLKVFFSSTKPTEESWIVDSEYPNFLQREILFPQTIMEYSTALENGVLTIILEKQIKNLELTIYSEKIQDKI